MNQDKWWVRRWPVASEWMALIAALYFALVADLIAKAGKYSSKIGILISYVVFAIIDTDTS